MYYNIYDIIVERSIRSTIIRFLKQVYLVRFVVMQDVDQPSSEDRFEDYFDDSKSTSHTTRNCKSATATCSPTKSKTIETAYPASVSIDVLLKAGKLAKPQPKNKVTITFETFDIKSREWTEVMEEELLVDTKKFASGAFRDAFHATGKKSAKNHQPTEWVVKTYNARAKSTIEGAASTSVEDHCRKQVQMHAVARHLTKKFQSKAPSSFGKCFKYDRCFYTSYNGEPATIEEYVPGTFAKIVNNDGQCIKPPEGASDQCNEIFAKAQCLVHYTYHSSEKKLMLLDIQGSDFTLYDPEIATDNVLDIETNEMYFCCGNCTTVGMEKFIHDHTCNKFCKLMGLPVLSGE